MYCVVSWVHGVSPPVFLACLTVIPFPCWPPSSFRPPTLGFCPWSTDEQRMAWSRATASTNCLMTNQPSEQIRRFRSKEDGHPGGQGEAECFRTNALCALPHPFSSAIAFLGREGERRRMSERACTLQLWAIFSSQLPFPRGAEVSDPVSG